MTLINILLLLNLGMQLFLSSHEFYTVRKLNLSISFIGFLGFSLASSAICFEAALLPAIGAKGAAGSGSLKVLFDKETAALKFNVKVSGLSSITTGAYITGPASMDIVSTAGVFRPLHEIPLYENSAAFTQTHYIEPEDLDATLNALSEGAFKIRIQTRKFLAGEVVGVIRPCVEER